MKSAGYAPYLDCRPPHEDETALLAKWTEPSWLRDQIETQATNFAVANLVAYHVASAGATALADKVLLAELRCLLALSRNSPDPHGAELGFDPFLNRIRLAALTGRAEVAAAAIDECLNSSDGYESGDGGSLLYGDRLFAGVERERLNDLLRSEKLLITWRGGWLSMMDRESANSFVAQHAEPSSQLRVEIELRLRLGAPDPPEFSVDRSASLKRALHRALIYVDQLDPRPDDLLLAVTRAGLERLNEMSFICPSTSERWARTALRWFAAHAADRVPFAEDAVSQVRKRISERVARSLDAVAGPPSPNGPPAGGSVAVEHVAYVLDFLERAST